MKKIYKVLSYILEECLFNDKGFLIIPLVMIITWLGIGVVSIFNIDIREELFIYPESNYQMLEKEMEEYLNKNNVGEEKLSYYLKEFDDVDYDKKNDILTLRKSKNNKFSIISVDTKIYDFLKGSQHYEIVRGSSKKGFYIGLIILFFVLLPLLFGVLIYLIFILILLLLNVIFYIILKVKSKE